MLTAELSIVFVDAQQSLRTPSNVFVSCFWTHTVAVGTDTAAPLRRTNALLVPVQFLMVQKLPVSTTPHLVGDL